MTAVAEMASVMSLNKSLRYAGLSKTAWYYTRTPRNVGTDQAMSEHIQEIAKQRPTYGTRRMAAQISRETQQPVNRKKIQRIYQKLAWNVPQESKSDIIRSSRRKMFKPDGPNQLWETDITYVWCGVDGWCYCFNVLDVYTRQWLAYRFDTGAATDIAVECVVAAVTSVKDLDVTRLRLRSDNGTQYASRQFRDSMKTLGIRQEFIWKSTPEQNGHIESFHGTLKREYIWPYDFARFQDAEVALARAFEDYNGRRIHSSISYMTPDEFARTCGRDGNK